MNQSPSPDLERSIQQSLQELALQMEKSLDEVAAERLCRDAQDLLNRTSYEPLTLARVAETLLVYRCKTQT